MIRRAVIVLTLLLSGAIAAPAMAGTPWAPVQLQCLNSDGSNGCVNGAAGFPGAWDIAISPDGRSAYIAAWGSGRLLVLDRNTTTGALTQKAGLNGCISEDGSGGACTDGRFLVQPDDVEVSPDGKQVYLAAGFGGPGGVSVFDRNETTGALTQKAGNAGCISDDGTANGAAGQCANGHGLPAAIGLSFSPDGKFIYIDGDASVAALSRNQTTGVLTQDAGQAGCINEHGTDGCRDGRALGFSRQMDISPDGTTLYVANDNNNSVAVLNRDATTGGLTQASGLEGCVSANGYPDPDNANVISCATMSQLTSPLSSAVSRSGGEVYVPVSDGIITFSRAGDGSLTFRNCIDDGGTAPCSNGRGLSTPLYLEISPDGGTVVTVLTGASGALLFDRDADGNLSQPNGRFGCVSTDGALMDGGVSVPDSCVVAPGIGSHGHVRFIGNESLWITNFTGSDAYLFKRDFLPVCTGQAVSVPFNTSLPVPLSCTDASSSGDAVTLSIAKPPVAGTLGAIDVANSRVFYNPFLGFSGNDSFTYRGSSNGFDGPPATVGLAVQPAPAGPVDADGDGSPSNVDCNDNNPAIRPGAFDIPGDGVDQDCSGADATARVNSKLNYAGNRSAKAVTPTRFTITGLPKGAKVSIICSGKKQNCPFSKRKKVSVKKNAKSVKLLKFFQKQRKGSKKKRTVPLRIGTTVEFDIQAPNLIGHFHKVTFAKKRTQLADGCLAVGTNSKISCR